MVTRYVDPRKFGNNTFNSSVYFRTFQLPISVYKLIPILINQDLPIPGKMPGPG
jgi:hypothetical protein